MRGCKRTRHDKSLGKRPATTKNYGLVLVPRDLESGWGLDAAFEVRGTGDSVAGYGTSYLSRAAKSQHQRGSIELASRGFNTAY